MLDVGIIEESQYQIAIILARPMSTVSSLFVDTIGL